MVRGGYSVVVTVYKCISASNGSPAQSTPEPIEPINNFFLSVINTDQHQSVLVSCGFLLGATVELSMTVWNGERAPLSAAREFWEFYRQYAHSAVHVASAAALTIFGLLVFIDPLFAAVAIAAYVCPPLVLYVLGVDVGTGSTEGDPVSTDGQTGANTVPNGDTGSDTDPGDTDSDSDDGDTDLDGADTDTDS